MSSHRFPSTPSDLSIAVFAKNIDFKKTVVEIINNNKGSCRKKGTLKIINTPDVFNERCSNPDQQIIDFMARCLPGPNLFILAVDSEHCKLQEVVVLINKLKTTIGENITAQLAVLTENIKIYTLLNSLKDIFTSIYLATVSEDLAFKCLNWCSGPFEYDYKHYSEEVVKRRKEELECYRHDCPPSCKHGDTRKSSTPSSSRSFSPCLSPAIQPPEDNAGSFSPCSSPAVKPPEAGAERGSGDPSLVLEYFSVVLLGKAGTGKTASANTILAAENMKFKKVFKSQPNWMPTTTECTATIVQKFGKSIRLVDTPDFFSDQIPNSQAQIEECKKYCRPGKCVVLLVMQLGRITDGEKGILEKLEETLGWKLRESTIILLTHGEDFEGDPEKFIRKSPSLNKMMEACGNRFHVFKNTSNNPKQVVELFRKFPNCEQNFPNLKGKKWQLLFELTLNH